MIFMLVMSIFFAVLASHKRYSSEWSILSGLLFLTWINTSVYSAVDPELYFIRALLTIIAALALLRCKSRMGLYHCFILLLTLIAYGMLAYDVSQHRHVLIYNYYEAVIYGLVVCQLISSYPTIRAGYTHFFTGDSINMEHGQVGEK